MRTRSLGLTLVLGAAFVITACTSAPGSPAASVAPDPCAGFAAGKDHKLPTDPKTIKVGVLTDVGTVNDKNFNEYTFVGAKNGALAIGAAEPPVTVPKDASEYAKGLQAYIDQGFDIIVTAGFNLGVATACAAKANPGVWFIGVDQGPPATVLPNLIALSYQEDQAGYLAGMAAASLSKSGTIGAIGGITLCGPCIRYIQGYELGAKSINPNIQVKTAYVTTSDFVKAFNDPVTGKNFGKQFIDQNKVDVLFQVAGKTGNGVLDAVCEAGIVGIGVDVDQALSYPNAAKCTATSAEKKLALAVETDIKAIAGGTAKGGDDHWDAKRDGVGYSPFHDFESKVPADLKGKLDAAFAQMKAGTLKTCPDTCGKLP
jgi:basic membrane protein A and related proteins